MNVSKRSARIRGARPDDLDALVDLENRSFVTDRVSRAQYRRHIGSASVAVLVAEADGRLVGSALVFLRRGSRAARLYSIAIDHQRRGMGVGAALLRAAEAIACDNGRDRLYLGPREVGGGRRNREPGQVRKGSREKQARDSAIAARTP